MSGEEYQKLAMRTNDNNSTDRIKKFANNNSNTSSNVKLGDLLNGCLGLSGEVGEVTDLIKKWVFHETPIDTLHIQKELGDVIWYVALLCESLGFNLDDIMYLNIEKLKNRYPNGFSIKDSNNRKPEDI